MREYLRKLKYKPNFLFANAGLLSETNSFDLKQYLTKYPIDEDDFVFNLFIGVQYLIHYMELISFNKSFLLHMIIERHINYIRQLTKLSKDLENKYISPQYFYMANYVLQVYCNSNESVIKQFSIDQIERICLFLTDKTYLMKINPSLIDNLYNFGFKLKTRVVYTSFLIPKSAKILEKLKYIDQKYFQKIESDCCCRTKIWKDTNRCLIDSEYLTMEVVFDIYRGNFLGFLDFLNYFIRGLGLNNSFIRASRLIMMTNDLLYVFLSDLPYSDLRLVEKDVKPGQMFPPFLSQNAVSKLIFNVYSEKMMDRHHKKLAEYISSKYRRNWILSNENMDFWKQFDSFLNHETFEYMVLRFLDSFNIWKAICIDFSSCLIGFEQTDNLKIEKRTNKKREEKRKKNIKKNESDDLNSISLPSSIDGDDSVEENSETKTENLEDEVVFHNEDSYDPFEEEMEELFYLMYQRKFDYTNTPLSSLNHILRGVLRCNTELSKEEERLLEYKAMREETIEYLTKKLYSKYWDISIKRCDDIVDHRRSSFCPVALMQYNKALTMSFDDSEDIGSNRKSSRKKDSSNFVIKDNKEDIRKSDKATEDVHTLSDISETAGKKSNKKKNIDEEVDEHSDIETIEKLGDMLRYHKGTCESFWEEEPSHNENLLNIFEEIKNKHSQMNMRDSFLDQLKYVFGDRNKATFVIFNEEKTVKMEAWKKLRKIDQEKSFLLRNTLHDIKYEIEDYYNYYVKDQTLELTTTNFIVNIYITLRILSQQEINDFIIFSGLLEGKPLNLRFLNNVNEHNTNSYITSLLPPSRSKFLRLSNCLTNIIYDFHVLCYTQDKVIVSMFKKHKDEFLSLFSHLPQEFKLVFEMMEFIKMLESSEKKLTGDKPGDSVAIYMENEVIAKQAHELLFNKTSNAFQGTRGCRVFYHSFRFNQIKARSLFAREAGDRRLRKIESNCHCLISMRVIVHKVTNIEEFLVEIFYSLMTGNHFKAVDMLRQLLSENGCLKTTFHKSLVSFPTGEVWVLNNNDWLKTHFNDLGTIHIKSVYAKAVNIVDLDKHTSEDIVKILQNLIDR